MSHRGLRAKIVLPCLPGGIGIVLQGADLNRDLPAWLKLRAVVLGRDDYRCRRCRRMMPPSELVVHHKRWVSRGGNDNVKNLLTVCQQPLGGCHAAYHPWLKLEGWKDPREVQRKLKST